MHTRAPRGGTAPAGPLFPEMSVAMTVMQGAWQVADSHTALSCKAQGQGWGGGALHNFSQLCPSPRLHSCAPLGLPGNRRLPP